MPKLAFASAATGWISFAILWSVFGAAAALLAPILVSLGVLLALALMTAAKNWFRATPHLYDVDLMVEQLRSIRAEAGRIEGQSRAEPASIQAKVG